MELKEIISNVESLFHRVAHEHAYYCKNEYALRDIESVISNIAYQFRDGYVSEKITEVQSFARIVYSPRKHLKYNDARGLLLNSIEKLRSGLSVYDKQESEHT